MFLIDLKLLSNSVMKFSIKYLSSIFSELIIRFLLLILSLIHRPFLVITARYFPSVVYGDLNSR